MLNVSSVQVRKKMESGKFFNTSDSESDAPDTLEITQEALRLSEVLGRAPTWVINKPETDERQACPGEGGQRSPEKGLRRLPLPFRLFAVFHFELLGGQWSGDGSTSCSKSSSQVSYFALTPTSCD